MVRGTPGVEKVVDHLTVAPGSIERVLAESQPLDPGKLPPPVLQPPPVAPKGVAVEPLPMFMAPPASPNDLNAPTMPPYAWPTYAPYNNYSRVAYPEAYPYNAWPFIGPCYPFPKVPLGWRSVKLEWDDGYWCGTAERPRNTIGGNYGRSESPADAAGKRLTASEVRFKEPGSRSTARLEEKEIRDARIGERSGKMRVCQSVLLRPSGPVGFSLGRNTVTMLSSGSMTHTRGTPKRMNCWIRRCIFDQLSVGDRTSTASFGRISEYVRDLALARPHRAVVVDDIRPLHRIGVMLPGYSCVVAENVAFPFLECVVPEQANTIPTHEPMPLSRS